MLTATVLEGFVNSVLANGFDQRSPTPDCHREWWELCCSKHRFVAIAAPRGFAKSTAITHSYTLASVLFRQRSFVLIVSDTETQAILFLQDIKKELQDNDALIDLFKIKRDGQGKVKLVKETESDIIVEFEDHSTQTPARFRIMAKGSEQKVRGLKWGNKRPDLIVCDDLENDEIVLNKDRREKFRRWFYGALLPCRADNGLVRIVGTILHMDALLERLMPEYQLATIRQHKAIVREELKEYTDYKLPWKSVKYRAHNSDYSKLLWAEKRSEDELKRIKQDYVAQGMPDVYAQEYLNVPLDEANSFFKKTDFKAMKEEDRERKKEFYITVDLAISEKERADYTVFMIGCLDEDRILYVTNLIRDRIDGQQIVETMIALQKAYDPVAFGVEDGQISKSIMPFLNEQMMATGQYLNLYPLKPSADKQTRARSIQARMRAGAVKFDKNTDWYQTLEDECLRFPRDKHDDQVDALAYLGQMVDKMVEAPTIQEQRDIEYHDEFTNSGNADAGRNAITGY